MKPYISIFFTFVACNRKTSKKDENETKIENLADVLNQLNEKKKINRIFIYFLFIDS